MRFVIRLLISVCIIAFCTQVGRKLPALVGLIAVMLLTGLIVLLWLYLDNPGNFSLMSDYCRGSVVGYFTDHFVFPCGFYLLSETAIPVDCALHGFCSLACSGIGASVVAQ